jgi:hypothetical protein
MKSPLLKAEANLFIKYLGIKNADDNLINRYCDAIQQLELTLTEKQVKIIHWLIRFPFLLPLVDGGFALLQPNNTIRERILVMSALIETTPAYTNNFLVQKNIIWPVFHFLYRGSVSVFKGIIGAILIIILRWK